MKIENILSCAKSKVTILNFFCLILGIIALFGYGACITSVYISLKESKIFSHEICFSDACVLNLTTATSNGLGIGKATSELLVAIATTGGIVVALLTYLTGERNSAFTNHLTHYTSFQTYVLSEIEKRNRINRSSVDISLWYNLIFAKSRKGNMDISLDYLIAINDINSSVGESNRQAQIARDGSFRYRPHQKKIKIHLERIGIEISFQPRNDFYEIEGQIFSLVTAVNKSFCQPNSLAGIEPRKYI